MQPGKTVAMEMPEDMQGTQPMADIPRAYGKLVCIHGSLSGREVWLDEQGVTVGREQGTAELVVDDSRISKRHVWIGVRNGEVRAIDRGSTNGTYLNQRSSDRVTDVALKPGDVLILADDVARFEFRRD